MIYPSIDKLLNVVSSKYELVHIIAKRSEEMEETGFYQMPMENYKSKKNLGRALEELADGLIIVKHN
jgi:DNA-directed RNA polymerase subunit omega